MRLLLIALALLVAAPAWASVEARRAGELQAEARAAYDDGDRDLALKRAEQAILLDDGPTTWLAQQIRIEVFEERGELKTAMGHLETYMGLEGLFPEHLAWGREARGRLEGKLIAAEARSQGAGTEAGVRRGIGVATMVGGAVPLATGIGFLANYQRLGGTDEFGGWAQAGGALLGVGIGLEVVGGVLLATSFAPAPVAVLPVPLDRGVGVAIVINPGVLP